MVMVYSEHGVRLMDQVTSSSIRSLRIRWTPAARPGPCWVPGKSDDGDRHGSCPRGAAGLAEKRPVSSVRPSSFPHGEPGQSSKPTHHRLFTD